MVREQGGVTGVSIISPCVSEELGLCSWSSSTYHLPFGGGFHICKTTQEICIRYYHLGTPGFPGGSVVRKPSATAGDTGLVPRLGRYPGEGKGNPL